MILSFEQIFRLREKKDHLINKLRISDESKNAYIDFFRKHPNLESKVNWNLIPDLIIYDMNNVIKTWEENDLNNTNKQMKISGDLSLMFKDWIKSGQAKLWYHDKNCIFISPLTYECAVFMNSFNCYGQGAKWCIGTKNDKSFWEKYVITNNSAFVFVYNAVTKKKFMLEVTGLDTYKVWDATDETVSFIRMEVERDIGNLYEMLNAIEVQLNSQTSHQLSVDWENDLFALFDEIIEKDKEEKQIKMRKEFLPKICRDIRELIVDYIIEIDEHMKKYGSLRFEDTKRMMNKFNNNDTFEEHLVTLVDCFEYNMDETTKEMAYKRLQQDEEFIKFFNKFLKKAHEIETN